ncbi:PilT protein domain-containing protein [Thioploca ingrica]|uniref:PilT protein domain-containing protein n=1 Tax=Thioploca ingrica TaxID=40754 RepID=A0A090BW72_9GAMM|nr:PilT protein domain-containing protein [Thioploca ingrica]
MGMKLFLDACAIIYLIEAGGEQGWKTRQLVNQHLSDGKKLFVSRLSVLECRILPLRNQDRALTERYVQFFALPEVEIIELTAAVVEQATVLRVHYPLRTPDALQAACALVVEADKFVTGDRQFSCVPVLKVELI